MIRKPSTLREAVVERSQFDAELAPDFEVDAYLNARVENERWATTQRHESVRAEVSVVLEKNMEPFFDFFVRSQSSMPPTMPRHYRASLPELLKGRLVQCVSTETDRHGGRVWISSNPLELSPQTHADILVWWDEHGELAPARRAAFNLGQELGNEFNLGDEEFEGGTPEEAARQWITHNRARVLNGRDGLEGLRASLVPLAAKTGVPMKQIEEAAIAGWGSGLANYIRIVREQAPTAKEVARQLRAAGLRVVPCGLNADWSVPAWFLSPGTANRTDHGFYLLNTEDQNYDNGVIFALVRRHFNEGGNDEVEELSSGTLAEVIVGARGIMERYT